MGQQRAVAERARPELAAALEPGDDPVGGQHLGDRRRRRRRAARTGHAAASQRGGRARRRSSRGRARRRGIGSGRSPRSAPTCRAAPSAVPGVAGGRLHPDLARTRVSAPDPGVGDAVERHAAGHGQDPVAGLLVQPAGQLEQHLLQARPARERPGRRARRPRCLVDRALRRQRAPVRTPAAAKPPSPVGVDELAQLVEEARLAVGGQRHHLVLVAGRAGSRGARSASS